MCHERQGDAGATAASTHSYQRPGRDLFLGMGQLDVLDGAFVLVDERGLRVHIPLGGLVASCWSQARA